MPDGMVDVIKLAALKVDIEQARRMTQVLAKLNDHEREVLADAVERLATCFSHR